MSLLTVRFRSAALALSLCSATGLLVAGPLATAAAAQDRGPVQRVVKGRVEDKNGTPIKGAVVYLRDGHTSTVKSAISQDDGTYRFVQLQQGTDYDLWAQVNDKKSKTRSISSFDSKNEFTFALVVD